MLIASEPLRQLRLKVAAGEAAEPRPTQSVKRLHNGRSHILLEFDPIQSSDRMRHLTERGLRFVALAAFSHQVMFPAGLGAEKGDLQF
jgi:hypothetical protein